MPAPAFDVEALRAEFPALAVAGRTGDRSCSSTGRAAPRSRSASSMPSPPTTATRTPTPAAPSSTSGLSDAIVDEAHAAVADFLGAARPRRSSSATTCRR